MATSEMTVFEKTIDELERWDGNGEPPAYPLYRGHYATALVDRYPKFSGQVVVFPNHGFLGQDVDMFDLPPSLRLSVELVTHTIGHHMGDAFGKRIIRHDEGFAVPDHPHSVLFPAERGVGVKLYQPSDFSPTPDYFAEMQELLALDARQRRILDQGIAALMLEATLLDPT